MDLAQAQNDTTPPTTPKSQTPSSSNMPSTSVQVPSPERPTFKAPSPILLLTPDPTPEKQFLTGTKRPLSAEPESPSDGRSSKRLATGSDSDSVEAIPISSLKNMPRVSGPGTSRTVRSFDPIKSPTPKKPKRSLCQNPKSVIVNLEDGPHKLRQARVSSIEVIRLAEALIRDIDWEEMEDTVACNRPGRVYRKMLKTILLKEAAKRARDEAEYDSTEESESSDDSDDTGSD